MISCKRKAKTVYVNKIKIKFSANIIAYLVVSLCIYTAEVMIMHFTSRCWNDMLSQVN